MATQGDVRYETGVVALGGLFAVAVVLDAVGLGVPFLRPVAGFLFLVPGLGGLVLQVVWIDPELRADCVAYAVGCGLVLVTAIGFLLNVALPIVGYSRPLAAGPMLVGILGTTVGLAAFVRRRRSPSWLSVPDRARLASAWRHLRAAGWQPALALLLPLAGVLATTALNVTNRPGPLLVVLVAVALVPTVVVLDLVEERYLPLLVGGTALAVLYHKSLWVGYAYGGHLSVVTVFKDQHWPITSEVLAVNGVLMPSLAHLLGVPILTQMKVVMPVLVAVIPLAMYVTFRQYVDSTTAVLGAAVFVFAHPFYYQYPSVARASIPVLFLALLGTAISDDYHHLLGRRLLALLFSVGLVVSHYGTSYYVMFALLGTLACFPVLSALDEAGKRHLRSDPTVPPEPYHRRMWSSISGGGLEVMRWDLVGFYLGSVITWYFYAAEGTKFEALIERVRNAYVSLFFEDDSGGGATAARLATDYGGVSIDYAENLYLSIALLIGVGMVVVVARRVVPRWDTGFDDEYVVTAGMVFVLFGGTILFSGEWGGGRPMMIVLSLTAVFAGVAIVTAGRLTVRGLAAAVAPFSIPAAIEVEASPGGLAGRAAFAAVLATLFVLNSGVMATVAYGGEAPSNVPSSDADAVDMTTDVRLHAWLTDHRSADEEIYGDRLARAQATDWMNGEIAAHTDDPPYRFRRTNFFESVDDPELEEGYLMLLRHNLVDGLVEVDYVTQRPIEEYRLDLDRRSQIYTNGEATVYYTDDAAREAADQRAS